jgi:nicotinamide-nucleotide amidase
MRAIFIAVGSELLDQERVDTNSLYVARKLMERGILMDMKIVVGDVAENLTWAIKNACKRAQLVVVTGGLGPTEDDITREAAATALKKELFFKEEIVDDIKDRFKKRGVVMPEINTRQAFVIEGADLLPNTIGTAPGQYIDDETFKLLLLPGPPREMKLMFDKVLAEKIAPLCNFFIFKRCFKFSGITESETDAMIADIYVKHRNVRTTVLATPGVIEVHLLGRSKKSVEDAQIETDAVAEKIKTKMGEFLITSEDINFEEYIVAELKRLNLTLSVAESCTGGGLGNRITHVPGSSEVFTGGVIAYSNEMKQKILGVSEKTLKTHGAVSRETAKEMACGVRELTGSDIAVAITGIAGPGGAVRGKPVGLVLIHLSAADTEIGIHKVFPGERKTVKIRTINESLNLLKKYLRGIPAPPAETLNNK